MASNGKNKECKMGWLKKLLFAIKIARTILSEGDKLFAEAKQVYVAYQNAVAASSEGGRKVTKSEWQKLAGESFDVVSLIFSWKK